MKKYLLGSFVVSAVLVPVLASAATADEIRVQIQSLLSQITALQSQLSNLTTDTTITTSTNTACPNLYRTLSRGSRGSDVISLQQFLIAQGLLGSDSATGFFGSMTEVAVQRWQAQNTIVSYGDANTTGYGVIGARTRAAIMMRCGSASAPTNFPRTRACPQYQMPVCGPGSHVQSGATDGNGCQSAAQCVPDPTTVSVNSNQTISVGSISSPIPQGQNLVITWQSTNATPRSYVGLTLLDAVSGETLGAIEHSIGSQFSTTGSFSWDGTYRDVDITKSIMEQSRGLACGDSGCRLSSSGQYKIRATLRPVNFCSEQYHETQVMCGSGTTNQSLAMSDSATFRVDLPQLNSSDFHASPASGQGPLAVKFIGAISSSGSYTIDFGDGSIGNMTVLNNGQAVCGSGGMSSDCKYGYVADHTYTNSGDYTAAMIKFPGPGVGVIGTTRITVW